LHGVGEKREWGRGREKNREVHREKQSQGEGKMKGERVTNRETWKES